MYIFNSTSNTKNNQEQSIIIEHTDNIILNVLNYLILIMFIQMSYSLFHKVFHQSNVKFLKIMIISALIIIQLINYIYNKKILKIQSSIFPFILCMIVLLIYILSIIYIQYINISHIINNFNNQENNIDPNNNQKRLKLLYAILPFITYLFILYFNFSIIVQYIINKFNYEFQYTILMIFITMYLFFITRNIKIDHINQSLLYKKTSEYLNIKVDNN